MTLPKGHLLVNHGSNVMGGNIVLLSVTHKAESYPCCFFLASGFVCVGESFMTHFESIYLSDEIHLA